MSPRAEPGHRQHIHKMDVIDRRGNRYFEHITDNETGEIIRVVDEPLTDHRGHGSAKPN
jgi:hypothetical protein